MISMLWGSTAYCVKLCREDLSRYLNKIESAGLSKCPYYHYLTTKVMWQYNKHFSGLATHHDRITAGIDMEWRNYATVTLCITLFTHWLPPSRITMLIKTQTDNEINDGDVARGVDKVRLVLRCIQLASRLRDRKVSCLGTIVRKVYSLHHTKSNSEPVHSLHFAWGVAEAKCILVTSVCVSVCLSLAAFPHCTDPGVTWGNGWGAP